MNLTTFFVNRFSKENESEKLSVIDEQLEYVKKKLDEIEKLSDEDYELLWTTIKIIRDLKTKI